MTKRSKIPRVEACTKVLLKLFRKRPNQLFRTIQLRNHASMFDDAMISNCTRILYNNRKINYSMIRGAKFYWLRRKEKGD